MSTLTATYCPNTFIESQTEDTTIYYIPSTGERWQITGKCIACGECEPDQGIYFEEDGRNEIAKIYTIWTGIPKGQPGACLDSRYGVRLDIPVRPELPTHCPSCTLTGVYLDPIK